MPNRSANAVPEVPRLAYERRLTALSPVAERACTTVEVKVGLHRSRCRFAMIDVGQPQRPNSRKSPWKLHALRQPCFHAPQKSGADNPSPFTGEGGPEGRGRVSLQFPLLAHRAMYLVREGGVEPPGPFGHRILSPARLPIPPLARRRSHKNLYHSQGESASAHRPKAMNTVLVTFVNNRVPPQVYPPCVWRAKSRRSRGELEGVPSCLNPRPTLKPTCGRPGAGRHSGSPRRRNS